MSVGRLTRSVLDIRLGLTFDHKQSLINRHVLGRQSADCIRFRRSVFPRGYWRALQGMTSPATGSPARSRCGVARPRRTLAEWYCETNSSPRIDEGARKVALDSAFAGAESRRVGKGRIAAAEMVQDRGGFIDGAMKYGRSAVDTGSSGTIGAAINGGNQAIGKAIRLLSSSRGRPIESLNDLTFAQYRSIIFCQANWPRFEPVFDSVREIVDADFESVNKIRNVVFHFRRRITTRDTDALRRFRDKRRYDRELFARQAAQSMNS
jgi:hypothetical protein